jgi:biopolymer transport protein ExbB|tara:strand:+ start:4861 stop:5415 length:555 start_codon:yes stop_codon:yes gene_type:complete
MSESISKGIISIWEQGGFVMPPLILLSLILFTALFRLGLEILRSSRTAHSSLSRKSISNDESNSAFEIETMAQERKEWRLHFDRRLKFVRIITTAAPLLGLLGTVAGMLKTFQALGMKEGIESIDLIASGISEALVTTETGLSIAIVGLILLWALKGWRRRLLIRFASNEAACALSNFKANPSC